jgi:predicted metal-binding membrane protein
VPSSDDTTVATALARRDRLLISVPLALLTVLAWVYLFRFDRSMAESMSYARTMEAMGMPMSELWTARDLVFTFVMWLVMMVGMMAPSAAPVLLLFAAARRARGDGLGSTITFGFGYLTIWAVFSAAAAVLQGVMHQSALLSMGMSTSSRALGGTILIVAGAYQLTPLKNACLTHCRSPIGFLMSHWRDGQAGAFAMGVRHGVYCLGCCWALMLVLFVVGVMNLVWVAILATLVLLEKVGPAGAWVSRGAGAAILASGLLMVIRG